MKNKIIHLIGLVSFILAKVLKKFNVVITIYSDMFGHQAWNIEYHIRRHIKKYKKFPKLIAVKSSSLVPNFGLYNHHKLYGIIVLPTRGLLSKFIKLGITYQKKLPNGRDVNSTNSNVFAITTMKNIFSEDVEILTNSKVSMPLTESESIEANIFLKKYNLEKGKYICFRDRDGSYMKDKSQESISLNKKDSSFIIRDYNINKGENIYDYSRNTPLTSYFKGIDKINKIGVKSVRYGASSNEKCPNKLVLDYSYAVRKKEYDITDLFLIENCKFYIGPPSGDEALAMMFNKPICSINSFPWPYINIPFSSDCMYAPQKLWKKNENKFMNLSEMALVEKKYNREDFISGLAQYELGIVPVKNSEEEIAEIMMEMNSRIDGTWDTERDIFKKYMTECNTSYSSKAILSTAFLEMNFDIL
jgi:putative glycosyltransferase (TIGR04372 family)